MADPMSSSKEPWPYNIGIPQRFTAKYQRYLQLGGLVDVTGDARAYAGDEPLRDVERLMFLSLAFDQIHKEGLEGDFAELGVYQGSTAAVLARHARRLNRHIYLMDTYEGFDPKDFSGMDAGRDQAFADTSLQAVRERVGEQNTSYIQGYFPQTAEQLPSDGRYCLVHIDTDLYAPIMSGLEYFYPRMVPGGFLIIHDYGSLAWEGAEKAVDLFFADKPESVIHVPDSSGSAVIRRIREPQAGPNWISKRQMLPMNVWHRAANGALANILTEGWSGAEDWGTWGVGKSHQIRVLAGTSDPVSVEMDVHAFVWDDTDGRFVDVFVDDAPKLVLTFTKVQNTAKVLLTPLHPVGKDGALTIEFRQRVIGVPQDLLPSSNDTRTLGIGLHRLRIQRV